MAHSFANTRSEAEFSACGKFRFWLSREWGIKQTFGVFLLINPSYADALILDSTTMICTNLALLWRWRGFGIVNLHPWIDSKPSNIIDVPTHERSENDRWIKESYYFSDIFVIATGEEYHVFMKEEIGRLGLPKTSDFNKYYSIGNPNAGGSYPHPKKWSFERKANLPESPKKISDLS